MKAVTFVIVVLCILLGTYFLVTNHRDVSKKAVSLFDQGQVEISLDPPYLFEYDTMKVGAIMHHNRPYRYDVVPKAIEGGLLFRGIHRQDSGTSIVINLKSASDIHFVFHVRKDGGYTEIFKGLKNWELESETPQYDVKGGVHGLDMLMYKLPSAIGIVKIPRSTADLGCFNIVFTEPKR